jgi:SAM-dependent methyltransferase
MMQVTPLRVTDNSPADGADESTRTSSQEDAGATPTDRTFDWPAFWDEADEVDRAGATPSDNHFPDALARFVEVRGVPDTVADVGCGAGNLVFELAERYPETTVVGYDVAESVLADNRQRARERSLDNVRFEQARLPEFDPDEEFDLVVSYFTLCYVADVEAAVDALYDAVAPGGEFVVNYQNELARSHWQTIAEAPDEHLDGSSAFDPERFEERFAVLLDGDSVLSYDAIHETLGTWPQSVWSVVEKPDVRWAWRHHPLVFVPK